MAEHSVLVPLGTPLPSFALPDLSGSLVASGELTAPALVVVFVCNHCPYVRHIETRLGEWADDMAPRGVQVVAIMSNDVAQYPDDDRPGMLDQVTRARWQFPYLTDATQHVARDFHAACTPDFFAYGSDRLLSYRGAFDQATPGNDEPVDGGLLTDAVTTILRGEAVPEPHRASMGCSIKWRAAG